MGYGNVPIPSYGCIAKISADSTISIRVVTWNINEKVGRAVSNHVFTVGLYLPGKDGVYPSLSLF